MNAINSLRNISYFSVIMYTCILYLKIHTHTHPSVHIRIYWDWKVHFISFKIVLYKKTVPKWNSAGNCNVNIKETRIMHAHNMSVRREKNKVFMCICLCAWVRVLAWACVRTILRMCSVLSCSATHCCKHMCTSCLCPKLCATWMKRAKTKQT